MFVDPTGLELVVGEVYATDDEGNYIVDEKATKEHREKIYNEILKLDPSAVIDYDSGIVSLDSEVDINGYEEGHKLVSTLVKDDNTHTIYDVKSKDTYDWFKKNNPKARMKPRNYNKNYVSYKGEGIGENKNEYDTAIFVNSDSEETASLIYVNGKLKKSESRPVFIGLAHEMIHSVNYGNGSRKLFMVSQYYCFDKLIQAETSLDELRTIGIWGYCSYDEYEKHYKWGLGIAFFGRNENGDYFFIKYFYKGDVTENMIRAEHKLPLRASHFGVPDDWEEK